MEGRTCGSIKIRGENLAIQLIIEAHNQTALKGQPTAVTDGGSRVTDGGWRVTDGGSTMTDGGWRITDGGWRVIDGGWRVTDGGSTMTDGGWRITDGGWRITDGGWRVINGSWRVPHGGWSSTFFSATRSENPVNRKPPLWRGSCTQNGLEGPARPQGPVLDPRVRPTTSSGVMQEALALCSGLHHGGGMCIRGVGGGGRGPIR